MNIHDEKFDEVMVDSYIWMSDSTEIPDKIGKVIAIKDKYVIIKITHQYDYNEKTTMWEVERMCESYKIILTLDTIENFEYKLFASLDELKSYSEA